MEEVILEVQDLTLQRGGRRILNRLSLQVWSGHVHALVGPNGAGKSTLASTIMGLSGYEGYEGEIRFDGELLNGLSVDERARRGITLAWQEPARFEGLPVWQFIAAGARDPSEPALRDALDRVGLSPEAYLPRSVDKTLSGGERKRIELASILAMQPRLVLMDEPDSGIDVEALGRIFEAIRHLKERGTTVVMITHSTTVLRQAEHAFLMCCGKLIDKGAVSRIDGYFGGKCIPCDHQNLPNDKEPAR
jgi:Fe-S cluster assembly ATP-binding protein